jgi:phosphatidylglycerol:prolipoprotein diacylglycerol transferase
MRVLLPSYSLLALAGIVLTSGIFFLFEPEARKKPVAHIIFLGTIMIASFFGSRVAQFLINLAMTRGSGASAEDVLLGTGATVTGGIVTAVLAVFIFAVFDPHRVVTWRSVDTLAAAFPFGHMMGRIGCQLAGCCYGRISTTFPLVVTYPDNWIITSGAAEQIPHGPRIASPLLEAGGLLLIGLLLVLLLRITRTRGQVSGLYFILYGVLRFFVETTRDDPTRGMWGPFSTGQWFSLWALAMGGALLIRYMVASRHGKTGPPFLPLNGRAPRDRDALQPKVPA